MPDTVALTGLQASRFADASDITAEDAREVLQAIVDSIINNVETSEQDLQSTLNLNGNYLKNVANLISAEVLLAGSSFAAQAPVAEEVPLQVEFGGAANSGVDPVMIDAPGTITINEDGIYEFTCELHADGSSGYLLGRVLVNGSQAGTTFFLQSVEDRDQTKTVRLPPTFYNATDTISVEIVRDAQGMNNGGLGVFTPSTIGWSDVPSATFEVLRYVVANEV